MCRSHVPEREGRLRLVALLALLAAGCGDDAPAADSAGDLLDVSEAALRLDVRIDGYEEDLVPIGATALHADGRIAFAQFQDGQVVVHSADGTRLTSVGREGDGPGEFRYTQYVGFVGDSLWAWDLRHRRLSFFALEPEPRFLRSVSIAGTLAHGGIDSLPPFERATPRGVYADGTVFAAVSGSLDPTLQSSVGTVLYVRTTVEGEVVYPVARVRRPRNMVTVSREIGNGRTTGMGTPLPWAMRSFVVSGNDPEDVAVVETAADAETSIATVRVTRLAGRDTSWTTEFRLQAHAITRERADSAVDAVVSRITDAQHAEWNMRSVYRDRVTFPPVVPPVSDAVFGAEGSVWIGLTPVPGYPDGTWIVLDASGHPSARVTIGGDGREVVAASHDVVWVSEADSLGVESLARYRLGR